MLRAMKESKIGTGCQEEKVQHLFDRFIISSSFYIGNWARIKVKSSLEQTYNPCKRLWILQRELEVQILVLQGAWQSIMLGDASSFGDKPADMKLLE